MQQFTSPCLAAEVVRDPYTFDFLTLRTDAAERDLERGLLDHIRKFLLELGAGFAFRGPAGASGRGWRGLLPLRKGWALPERVVRGGVLRGGHRHVASRLSGGILRQLRIPRGLWPPLRAVDRKMRALRREHARYAGAIGRIKRIAGVAG